MKWLNSIFSTLKKIKLLPKYSNQMFWLPIFRVFCPSFRKEKIHSILKLCYIVCDQCLVYYFHELYVYTQKHIKKISKE